METDQQFAPDLFSLLIIVEAAIIQQNSIAVDEDDQSEEFAL